MIVAVILMSGGFSEALAALGQSFVERKGQLPERVVGVGKADFVHVFGGAPQP